MSTLRYIYDWMGNKVYSRYANFTLGFLFFLEAIFFLPTDPMLVFYCVERRANAFWYATIATIGSLLGALISYAIGFLVWVYVGFAITHNHYVHYLIRPETFTHICNQFKEYDWFTLLLAGFSPIPFKAVTLVAGFCKISLITFIICVIITRAFRFYLMATIIYLYGNFIKEMIDRYFTIISGIAVLCLVVALFYFNTK